MSKICEYCGKEFDIEEARDDFEMETSKNYNQLTKCLCAECAIEAINDMADGVYYEVCENCGSKFNPFLDEVELQQATGDDGATIDMFEKYLCLDCSLDKYAEFINSDNENC